MFCFCIDRVSTLFDLTIIIYSHNRKVYVLISAVKNITLVFILLLNREMLIFNLYVDCIYSQIMYLHNEQATIH